MIYIALLVLIVALLLGVPVPVSFMASAAWLIFFGGPEGVAKGLVSVRLAVPEVADRKSVV